MTTEDEEYLKSYNAKWTGNTQLSEDDFEQIMEVFEDTAGEQTPYASIDNTVVPYEVMAQALNHIISAKLIQSHAKNVYEYWKTRRQGSTNKPLQSSLKFETHQEHDDMDPYVCFRRREVRQTRKTRARDAQVSDKLKRLRRELEEARQLVVFSCQRELFKKELLGSDRMVFEHRARLKETKTRLGIRGEDDDLYNSRPQKRPRTEAPPRPVPHTQLRLVVRPDGGKSVEPADLAVLSDKLAEKENELRSDVEQKVQNHRRWNQNYVDMTADPLPPVQETKPSFRPAQTRYLMTPPASASDSMEGEVAPLTSLADVHDSLVQPDFPGFSPSTEDERGMSSFRRRVGRLNRLFIDRRPPKVNGPTDPREIDYAQSDRWKYDQDSDDEDEQPVYQVDPNSARQMKFRSTIPPSQFLFRRQGGDPIVAQTNGATRQALPQPQAAPVQPQAQQPQPQPAQPAQSSPA